MMKPLVPVFLALAAISAGCGGSGDDASGVERNTSPFAYDAAAPLHYVDRGVVNHDYAIRIHDVSFRAGGRRVDGLAGRSARQGAVPCGLYLHGSGGDRTQLLLPATWMAARGVVALTITMPEGSVPAQAAAAQRLAAERRAAVGTVIAARRAVDALQVLPEVDRSEIGLVGWSAGARVGAILAGVEPRLRALDLFSGGSPPVSEYAALAPAELRPTVRRELGAVDPLRWVAHARSGSILLQDGRTDEIVPRKALQALAKAAGGAAEVRWYDQGHAPSRAAYADQLDWMAAKLGVGGPVVKGVDAGP